MSKLMKRKLRWARERAAEFDAALVAVRAEMRAAEDRERRRQLGALAGLLRANRAWTFASVRDGRSPANRRAAASAAKAVERAERALLVAHGHEVAADVWRSSREMEELLRSCDDRAVL